MSVINTKINIGLTEPFSVVHITDTHIAYADERDTERKLALSERRLKEFPHAEETLTLASEISKSLNLPIVHTGDLLDFVSFANIERAKRFTDENDCFTAAGNHEFSLYLGEAKEDAAYRNQSLGKVQSAFKNDIRTASRIIGGVNFVALDDGYYLFEKEQIDFLKKETERGLPIVLLLHCPLFDKDLYDTEMKKSPCGYVVGAPVELMECYPPDRFEQQLADDLTLDAIEFIANESSIKAIIAGHMHYNYEGFFRDKPQILTSCTDVRIITFE